jgi:hypothetical protein
LSKGLKAMLTALLRIPLVVGLCFFLASFASADVKVKGYYRKDGTYIRPHYRSNPDGNFYNNWSTVGNVNPYTGKPGTKRRPPAGYGGSSVSGLAHSDPPATKPRDEGKPASGVDRLVDVPDSGIPPAERDPEVDAPAREEVAELPAADKPIADDAAAPDSEEPKLLPSRTGRDYELTETEVVTLDEDERRYLLMQKRRMARQDRRDARRQSLAKTSTLDDEALAAAKFSLAKSLYEAGKVEESESWLIRIVEEFPSTTTAEKAIVARARIAAKLKAAPPPQEPKLLAMGG